MIDKLEQYQVQGREEINSLFSDFQNSTYRGMEHEDAAMQMSMRLNHAEQQLQSCTAQGESLVLKLTSDLVAAKAHAEQQRVDILEAQRIAEQHQKEVQDVAATSEHYRLTAERLAAEVDHSRQCAETIAVQAQAAIAAQRADADSDRQVMVSARTQQAAERSRLEADVEAWMKGQRIASDQMAQKASLLAAAQEELKRSETSIAVERAKMETDMQDLVVFKENIEYQRQAVANLGNLEATKRDAKVEELRRQLVAANETAAAAVRAQCAGLPPPMPTIDMSKVGTKRAEPTLPWETAVSVESARPRAAAASSLTSQPPQMDGTVAASSPFCANAGQ